MKYKLIIILIFVFIISYKKIHYDFLRFMIISSLSIYRVEFGLTWTSHLSNLKADPVLKTTVAPSYGLTGCVLPFLPLTDFLYIRDRSQVLNTDRIDTTSKRLCCIVKQLFALL